MRVDIGAEFFALLAPGTVAAVHLFTKNPVILGVGWPKAKPRPSGRIQRGGRGPFLCVMDTESGRLYRFTQDG